MRPRIRLSISTMAIAALAACSRSSEQPALSDDLKQDLARTGGSDVQLAGMPTGRVDVVSAVERTGGAVAAPKAPSVSRAPSAIRGRTPVVRGARRGVPAAAQPAPPAQDIRPAEAPRVEPLPEPVPARGRMQAPQPSTQREPRGGWRTPGEVIRNAPFPINP